MSQTQSPNPIYVRVSQALERFGVHRSTIYRWAKDNKLRIYKHGAISVVKVAEITALFEGEGAAA